MKEVKAEKGGGRRLKKGLLPLSHSLPNTFLPHTTFLGRPASLHHLHHYHHTTRRLPHRPLPAPRCAA